MFNAIRRALQSLRGRSADPTYIGQIFCAGRGWVHRYANGLELPVIAGGDGEPTLQEMVDERSQLVTTMDEIIKTAKEDGERSLNEQERTDYDAAAERFDTLTTAIDQAHAAQSDATRASSLEERRQRINPAAPVPGVNTPPASANRSLDELLWASAEDVPAGTYHHNGQFIPSEHGARNAVEQVAVRTADDDHIALAPRITDFRPEHVGAVRNFQRTVADMAIFGMLVDRSAKTSSDGFEVARSHKLMKGRWESALRALDVDTAGEGSEWVPTGIGSQLHEKVRAAGKVGPLFARVDMPTNPWKWPIEGADATAYRVAEPTSDSASKVTASTPGSGAATFDAEIMGGRTLFSRSVEADSIIAILPFVQNKLARAFVDAEEKAIIDGDSDGTHQDSDVSGSTDMRTAWDGLRKKGLAQTSHDGGSVTITLALFRALRAKMGKYGLNPSDLAAICSVGVYYDLLGLDEVKTVDKYGPQATVLNGELAKLDGIPIVVSEHFREDLNATGVHDGVTTTQTGLAMVNRGEWAIGQRMALDVEVDDSIYRESFQRVVVAFMREDFQHIGDAAANDDTAFLFNLD